MTASGQSSPQMGGKPTIVLVHGAFADASSWSDVIARLQREGYTVIAPANPLRGLTVDVPYTASVLKQIDGPVLLVGHSYGGVVISNAAVDAPNVVGLVFIAAFAPDEGERLGEVAASSKDSVLNKFILPRQYPDGPGGKPGTEFYVDPQHFREAFAADVPDERCAVMSAAQRPLAEIAFADISGPVAWKKLPSWAVVGAGDKAAGADLVRSMAQRAGAKSVEIKGSHVIMVSQPQAVTDLILEAARSVAAAPAPAGARR